MRLLKKLVINNRKIPVPIPILNLGEALLWIEKHLLRPDHSITRVTLDSQDIDYVDGLSQQWQSKKIEDEQELRCKIDSPTEICLQTIDALRNLSTVIARNLKPVAVHLWEFKGHRLPLETKSILDDVGLLVELLEHILVLLDRRVDTTQVNAIHEAISHASLGTQYGESQSDWRGIARVLLQQLEPPILELATELTSLEKGVFEMEAERRLEQKCQIKGALG